MLGRLGPVAFWLCLSLAPVAGAQSSAPTPEEIGQAAEAFDRGREAYQVENYTAAAEQFERADAKAPSPIALEYAIRSRDKAGQLDKAATLAALAEKRHPDEENLRAVVPEILERARSELFELLVECTEPCELAISGKIVHGGYDQRRVIYLSEGSHTLSAGFGKKRSDSQTVQAVAGTQGQLAFEVPADEPEPAVEPEPEYEPDFDEPKPKEIIVESEGWSPTVFWVGLGVTVATGAVTTWSGIDTKNSPGEDRVRAECDPGDTSCPVYKEGLRKQLRTNVLIGATTVFGLSTIIVGAFATDWGGGSQPPADDLARNNTTTPRIEPWLSVGDGAMMGARGRF